MKKIFKKNHIIITVLALLIAVAGYINYTDNIKDKAKDKNNVNQVDGEIQNNDAEPDDNSITDPGAAIFTSTEISQFIVSAKLEREQVRAANKETLLEIIDSETLQDDAKKDAIAQMVQLTDVAEKEAAAELLLEAKGFSNVIVSISGSQVDVVVETQELTESDLAQVEDVVTRKTGCGVDALTITSVSPAADNKTNTEAEVTPDEENPEDENDKAADKASNEVSGDTSNENTDDESDKENTNIK